MGGRRGGFRAPDRSIDVGVRTDPDRRAHRRQAGRRHHPPRSRADQGTLHARHGRAGTAIIRYVSSASMPSDLIRGWAPVRVKETRQELNSDCFYHPRNYRLAPCHRGCASPRWGRRFSAAFRSRTGGRACAGLRSGRACLRFGLFRSGSADGEDRGSADWADRYPAVLGAGTARGDCQISSSMRWPPVPASRSPPVSAGLSAIASRQAGNVLTRTIPAGTRPARIDLIADLVSR